MEDDLGPDLDLEAVDEPPAWPAPHPADPLAVLGGTPADHPTVIAMELERLDFTQRFPVSAQLLDMPEQVEISSKDSAKGGRHGRNHHAAVIQSQRDYEALQLRAKGLDFRSIALIMGFVSATGKPDGKKVSRMIDRALARQAKAHGAEVVRQMELVRLDKLTETLMSVLENLTRIGNLNQVGKNVDRLLAIQERRAKLLGLDAPTRVQTNATLGVNGSVDVKHTHHVEVAENIVEYLDLVKQLVDEQKQPTVAELAMAGAIDVESEEDDLAS